MKHFVIFSFITMLLACKTKSVVPLGCTTIGTVKNFSSLDGCGFLIELGNGDLLNPVKINGTFQIEDQQVISFSYVKLDDMMSICMREKASVEITCIQALGDTPAGSIGCYNTNNPFEVEWMDQAIDLHNPNQILKYEVKKEWAYLFRSFPNSYLYNCKGKLICETKNDHDNCLNRHIAPLGEGQVIWQGEGVWD